MTYRLFQPMKQVRRIATAFLLLGLCQALPVKASDTPWTKAKIQINGTVLTLPVADTKEKSSRGLMGRADLAEDDGMIFPLYARGIWMKDCLTDLDIVFVTQPPYGPLSDWKVDHIVTATKPAPGSDDATLPFYLPTGTYPQSVFDSAFSADNKDFFCGNEAMYRLFGTLGLVIELKPGWAARHGVKVGDVVKVLDVDHRPAAHPWQMKIKNIPLDVEVSAAWELASSDADSPSRFALKGQQIKAFFGPMPGLWMKGMSAPVDLVFIQFGSVNNPLDPGKVVAWYAAKPMGDQVKDDDQQVYTAVGVFKQKDIPVGSPTWKKAWMTTGTLLVMPAGWVNAHGIKVGDDVSCATLPVIRKDK